MHVQLLKLLYTRNQLYNESQPAQSTVKAKVRAINLLVHSLAHRPELGRSGRVWSGLVWSLMIYATARDKTNAQVIELQSQKCR